MFKKELVGWSIFGTYYRFKKVRTAFVIWLIDKIGAFLFIFRKKKLKKKPASILIIQLDHIGDMVLNSSLITLVKRSYPDAKLSVLIRSLSKPVAEVIEGIDDIIILHTPWLSREKHAGYMGVLKFCLQNFKKYDLVFEVHGEIRNNFLAWMIGKFCVGTAIRGGGFFLNRQIPWDSKYFAHLCEMQNRMLQEVSSERSETAAPAITIPLSAQRKVADLLKKESLQSKGYVFIQMSTGGKNRLWPLEHWKKFVELVISSGYHVVCADLDKEKVSGIDPNSPAFHIMNTSLIEYAELVRNAIAVVSVDTFAGHIAACFEIPTVSIFSGYNIWDEWRPFNKNVEHFQDTSCPEYLCGNPDCIYGFYSPCMKRISPEMVFDAFDKLVKKLTDDILKQRDIRVSPHPLDLKAPT
jgi:ADP-heptose:LPS heptosyltransferase